MDFCDNQHNATNSVDWVWLVPNPEYSLNMFMKISANKRVVFNSAVLCECVRSTGYINTTTQICSIDVAASKSERGETGICHYD